jgi:hypothetical protein
MADSILRLKVESQEYDSKLKQATQGLTRYADECRKIGGTLEVVEKETLDYVRALGQMETNSRTATGKLAEMKKAYVELSAQYKQMTDAEKASPFGKALAASLDELKGRIGESKAQLDDINKSINGGGGLTGALDAVAGKFGLSIDQVTKFGGVVGVATTAIQVAKDAFFQSESNIDEWGRTVEGAKGAYSVFLDTLNNGNWSNFFQNLSAAIRGGRDLYDVFDRLGSIKSNNAAAIAITQKEIAELRLAKQQGENVDAKLKSATERLKALQGQSVAAGQRAGTQSAFQTIRNGVNSVGGASINDATIKYAVDRIMRNGQSEFDKYARNRDILRERGMVTKTQTIYDSQGGSYERQYREFDINALTKEQQKQYALAQAITEGETRIQAGISAYAQAVSEGTASAREAFKGNRYALQGSTGGGGGRSGGGSSSKGFDISSIAFDANKAMLAAVKAPDVEGGSEAWNTMREAIAGCKEEMADYSAETENWTKNFDPYRENMEKMTKAAKQQQMAFNMGAEAANNLGAAFSQMEDPAARAAGTVIQAISSIALGFAMASVQAGALGPFGWIAWLAAGTAALATTISTVHSLTGFANGGIVGGNSYSGDNVFAGNAMVNSGELILNHAQQNAVASELQSGPRAIQVTGRLRGSDIVLSIDRELQQSGRGQLLTWG